MRTWVSAAQQETGATVDETTQLLAQRKELQTKQRIVERISGHYSISPEDREILTAPQEPIDEGFFKALADVKRIHRDCEVLLGADDQTLGLDIMERTSKTLNRAFEKLYRWINDEFKNLDLESPQMNATIRRAIHVLAERPTLFQDCLTFFAESREKVLLESFRTALTGSQQSGQQPQSHAKPIELSAPDPQRYVGDMLAWVHSTTVSEREALEALFVGEGEELRKGVQAALERDPWERSRAEGGIEAFDGTKTLNDLVNRSLKSVVGLLRQRVEPVITAYDEPTAVYRLATLIPFYLSTFEKLLGKDASILDTLKGLQDLAQEQFRSLIKDRVLEIRDESVDLPSADLGPPPFLREALGQLREIMKSYDTSFAPAAASREVDFQPSLKEALNPFLHRCEELAEDINAPRKEIFILNALLPTRKELQPFSFTSERVAELNGKIDELAQTLIENQHEFLLHASGLDSLLQALSSVADSGPDDDDDDGEEIEIKRIATLSPFQPQALRATSQRLDSFLPSAIMDATERLKLLQDSKLVHDITEESARRFCEDFEGVEGKILAVDDFLHKEEKKLDTDDAVQNEEEGEETIMLLRECFPRTSAEIRVLLT